MDESKDWTGAHRARFDAKSEFERKEWERTGNPVHVWRAVDAAASFAREEVLHFADLPGLFARMKSDETRKAAEEEWRQMIDTPSYPLPAWVNLYLADVAFRITCLAALRDLRALPDHDLAPWTPAQHEEWRRWRNGSLTVEQAMALVPNALHLVRPGANAFKTLKSEGHTQAARNRYDHLLESLGDQGAIGALTTELGLQDMRSTRRLLQKARRISRERFEPDQT